MSIFQTKVSHGEEIDSNKLQITTLGEVLKKIKSDERIKSITQRVRSADNKDKRKELKKKLLPYFNLGTFKNNVRQKQNLISTIFMILDYDELSDAEIKDLQEKLKRNQNVFSFFLSPSGMGIKVVLRFESEITDHEQFKNNYVHYAEIFSNEFGLKSDSTQDASRACFYSHDENIYINEEAELLEVITFPEPKIDLSAIKTDDEAYLADAVNYLHDKINDYEDWFRCGMALASLGERGRSFFHELSRNPKYNDTPQEIDNKFSNFLETSEGKINLATLFETAKKYGFKYTSKKQTVTKLNRNDDFVNELLEQFEIDDNRVIGELIGYGMNKFSDIAAALDGIQPGFYHLAADTNIGKTAVYTNMALDILESNKDTTILFFALDDSKKYAANRYLTILSDLEFKQVKYGLNNLEEYEKDNLIEGRESLIDLLKSKRLTIYDISDIQHIDQLEEEIKKYHHEDLVVMIDGLYNLEVSDGSKEGIRQENIERAQKVKRLVDTYRIPVFTTGEFRKKTKGEGENKKPTIDDLMETGKFAYNANVVWLLYPRDAKLKNDPRVELVLEFAKNKISDFKGEKGLTFIRAKGKVTQDIINFSSGHKLILNNPNRQEDKYEHIGDGDFD